MVNQGQDSSSILNLTRTLWYDVIEDKDTVLVLPLIRLAGTRGEKGEESVNCFLL